MGDITLSFCPNQTSYHPIPNGWRCACKLHYAHLDGTEDKEKSTRAKVRSEMYLVEMNRFNNRLHAALVDKNTSQEEKERRVKEIKEAVHALGEEKERDDQEFSDRVDRGRAGGGRPRSSEMSHSLTHSGVELSLDQMILSLSDGNFSKNMSIEYEASLTVQLLAERTRSEERQARFEGWTILRKENREHRRLEQKKHYAELSKHVEISGEGTQPSSIVEEDTISLIPKPLRLGKK